MKKIYIEFLNELYIQLEKNHDLMWAGWMKRSIQKFNDNEDIDYFLSAFGGMGSFNDYFTENMIIEDLKSITSSCAYVLKNNCNEQISSILKQEIERINNGIQQEEKFPSPFSSKQLDYYNEMLDYATYIYENYKQGNLNLITHNYLNQKDNQIKIK